MMMCFAVWWPSPQLHSGNRTDGTRAWYKKALKPFFLVHMCIVKAISGLCISSFSAKTSVLGGASMDVKRAGFLAEACHMLWQDCWAFCIACFRRLNGRRGSSFGSHWRVQASLLWWVVVEASREELRVALLSLPLSSLPLSSPAALPLSPSFPSLSSNVLPLTFSWFLLPALLLPLPPTCLSSSPTHLSTFWTASLIAPAASDSSCLTLNRAWMQSRWIPSGGTPTSPSKSLMGVAL